MVQALAINGMTATRAMVIAQRTSNEQIGLVKAMMIEQLKEKLANGVECIGAIRDDTNVLYPVFTIRVHEVINVNYCYIPTLGRYYFIDSITYL